VGTSNPTNNLFVPSQRVVAKKDQDVPPATVRNITNDRTEAKKTFEQTEKDKSSGKDHRPEPTPLTSVVDATDDDDSWGGLPSFLRRK
jgi:hypothetical protein